MTALLVIIIVLEVVNIITTGYVYWKEMKGTIELGLIFTNLTKYFKQSAEKLEKIEKFIDISIKDSIETISRNQELTCDKLHRIESKLYEIEAKTPYKKRERKMKVNGVEVPLEAQETKSAKANGTETIIDNAESNKEATNDNK